MSSASFAYPGHPGEVRARLAERVRGREPEEGLLLATCLRLELTVPGDGTALQSALVDLVGDLLADVEPVLREGEEAVVHLFRVAAGLESPILGEQEVLTQFRQAVVAAEERGAAGGLFARLLESAVSVGRKARELLPDSPHSSMAAVAAQAVGSSGEVVVLGSGIMAIAVVEALLQLPAPPRVAVVARHPEKVSIDADVEIWPFPQAAQALASFPAVVSATSAKRRLVDDATMAHIIAERTSPLLLVDMAMPPDFDRVASEAVTYMDIDDLAAMAGRRSRAAEADDLVSQAAAEAYLHLRHHHEVAPVISGLLRAADQVVEEAVARFAGKLGRGDDESVLRQTAHTVARTLVAGPVAYVKEAPEAVDIVADAFGVEDG